VHAYLGKNGEDKILIECEGETTDGYGGVLHIKITDYGCGIEDVEKALVPFYTTLADEERSGMGFTIMQTFTDEFSVKSEKGKGTVVELIKRVGAESLCSEGIDAANREKERLNA
jgi:stage II sporulation protein AB (anti-sigma F factor)